MLHKLKISVILPVYNGENFLAEAIESVLKQTFEDFELVISDNCSTDNTKEIIKSFRDKRVKYFRNSSNLGMPRNWNKAVGYSQSEYIHVFAHDDIMLADNLAKKVEIFDKCPKAGFLHCSCYIFDSKGNLIRIDDPWPEERREYFISDGFSYFKKLFNYNIIWSPSVLIRKEPFLKLGGFDPKITLAFDLEMWMRLSLFYDVAYLKTPLIGYRMHETNANRALKDTKLLSEFYQVKGSIIDKHHLQIANTPALKQIIVSDFFISAITWAFRNFLTGRYSIMKSELAFAWQMLRKLPNNLLSIMVITRVIVARVINKLTKHVGQLDYRRYISKNEF